MPRGFLRQLKTRKTTTKVLNLQPFFKNCNPIINDDVSKQKIFYLSRSLNHATVRDKESNFEAYIFFISCSFFPVRADAGFRYL